MGRTERLVWLKTESRSASPSVQPLTSVSYTSERAWRACDLLPSAIDQQLANMQMKSALRYSYVYVVTTVHGINKRQFKNLLDIATKDILFMFNDQTFKQIDGVAMVEIEREGHIPFLDIDIKKCNGTFVTSVYRKPTYTGLTTQYDSLIPQRYKTNLVQTLVMRLLTKGNKERTCEPTAANKTSSRSHALLQVNVRQSEKKGNHEEVKNARLFMVDLAGSERAKQTQNKGKRLQEGAHINRSLLALGNCINALAEGRAKYVNYRDSKLTRLLKDALSGNCRTVMIAHVSPCHVHREETRNTLIYADRAKNISKQVRRNVLDVSYHVSQYQNIISELKEEIDRLKGKLEGGREESAGSGAAPLSQEAKEEQQKNAERLKKIKNDLLDLFREQMSLRNKLMEIDNNILALSMEFERQNMVVTEWESERARRLKGRQEPTKGPNGEEIIDMDTDKEKDEDSDDDEPEEVTQAWEDLMYLQKEQQRYTEMREKVEQEMNEVKKRAKEMEELLTKRKRCRKRLRRCRKLLRKWKEALPETITTDEQRELISLLCKVHELEIQKVEMQSEALLKEHELRRRDLLIMRYDRQRNLCDEIITRQRQVIEAMNDGNSELSTGMPPELQELYALYQMEAQYANSERDIKYLNDANNLLRCPSTLSLRATSFEKLPPIFNNNNKEPEKLFDRPARRHSLGDVRRPESVLSLRSPTSSASSSAPGTASESRVCSLPPISGASADAADVRLGTRNINALAARRRGSRASGPSSDRLGSSDALDELTDPDSPGGLRLLRRRSNVPSDDSISLLSLRLDSPPRKARPVRPYVIERKLRSRQKPLSRRGSLALLQPAQLRRRRGGSASSSEGDSPSRASNKHHRRDLAAPPLRRRGNSLTRLNAGANGNARRRSIPARKGGRKSPDMFNQVGFALHY
ncbi:kinesin-like protein KIF19 [Penaeus japonicus]|uniref:kinesin-like protein KIF19 n=1 Tax=Penaeus japonicus TaxID=27405 RepID=UPI001C711812|nr:kinesin-like protein KIF19 [Penaeus japonicus]